MARSVRMGANVAAVGDVEVIDGVAFAADGTTCIECDTDHANSPYLWHFQCRYRGAVDGWGTSRFTDGTTVPLRSCRP